MKLTEERERERERERGKIRKKLLKQFLLIFVLLFFEKKHNPKMVQIKGLCQSFQTVFGYSSSLVFYSNMHSLSFTIFPSPLFLFLESFIEP